MNTPHGSKDPHKPQKTLARDYYNRVRPLLGDRLESARLAVWDLGFGYLGAEALARTGLRRQTWFDSGVAGGAFCRSLGQQWSGQTRGEALERHCGEHNTLERHWELRTRPQDLEALAQSLREDPPDLLLARGDADAAHLARLAMDLGIPLVITFVPRSSPIRCLQVVWAPESVADPDAVLHACAQLATLPVRDLDLPSAHLDGLEARSQSLSLGRWLLQRQHEQREDLLRPILEQGRFLLARGAPDWPWSTRFLSRPPVSQRFNQGSHPYLPPLSLLEGGSLLVMGLGTASLFCAEAGILFSRMVFVDCKDVSIFNPVRQIYGTAQVGREKADAMVDILCGRLDPAGQWASQEDGAVSYRCTDHLALGSASIRLSAQDPSSVALFGDLLDRVRPTMAVVGMGRSQDDNFIATAELRRRGIRHITPTAFPAVTHYKHILTDGPDGPCYDCLQGHLPLDGGAGPTLSREEQEMFYGGTQPATLAETYPSAHSLLRLARDLALPRAARPVYLLRELAAERNCFVGANRVERRDGQWLYGMDRPFSMVTYGVSEMIGSESRRRCSCGRSNIG